MHEALSPVTVLSFYSFTEVKSISELMAKILLICKKKYVKGTILISSEGINGSIAGSDENIDIVIQNIVTFLKLKVENFDIKKNYCKTQPFDKLKVKIKREIVTMGVKDIDIANQRGEYIQPDEWDNFILQPNCVVVDTRNTYETNIGSFAKSLFPDTETFRQFPAWVKNNQDKLQGKKIAMFCTGGIRCEKSTAYLKKLGFKDVYHLKGGILNYLEKTGNASQMWKGDCFVFDNRQAVNQKLTPVNEDNN